MPALAQWHMGNSGDFETAIGVLPPLDYGLPPCLELSVSVGAIDQVEAWGVIGDMSRQAFAEFAADVAKRVGADS